MHYFNVLLVISWSISFFHKIQRNKNNKLAYWIWSSFITCKYRSSHQRGVLWKNVFLEISQMVNGDTKWRHKDTLSHYPGWIHPGEFPGENLVRKITPRWKTFGFFTSLTKLHNLLHPRKNNASLIVPSEFLNSTRWVLILPLWYYWYSLVCGSITLESRQSEITPLPEFRLNFFVTIDWFLFVFADFLW